MKILQKITKEVFQMAGEKFPCTMLLGGLSASLHHLKGDVVDISGSITCPRTLWMVLQTPT